jgi:hypothetical protein
VYRLLRLENKLFTEERLRLFGYGGIFIFVFLFTWVAFYKYPWPFLTSGIPRCIDFGFFWLSGKLAAGGHTAQIFDFKTWLAIQDAFFNPNGTDPYACANYNRFFYPPTLLFLTIPLGLLPYAVALGMWILTTFAFYEVTIYAIVPRRTTLIVAATPAFVILANVFMGHNGFFTAALIGLVLVFLERRPWLAGIFLAVLTYKPQFGLLFPIALVASRNWRVIVVATAVTVALGLLAAMSFGSAGWAEFIAAFHDRGSDLGPAPGVEPRLQTVFGFFELLGASPWLSWVVQAIVSVIVIVGIWTLWSAKQISYNLKAAALCAGLFLVSPYALFYDLSILCVAVAFFVKEGLARGFLPGERVTMLGFWVALLFLTWRSGPVIGAILVLLITRRVVFFGIRSVFGEQASLLLEFRA